jgi:hypothetical protein
MGQPTRLTFKQIGRIHRPRRPDGGLQCCARSKFGWREHDQVPSRKGDNTFNMPDREVKKIKGLKGCFVDSVRAVQRIFGRQKSSTSHFVAISSVIVMISAVGHKLLHRFKMCDQLLIGCVVLILAAAGVAIVDGDRVATVFAWIGE